MTRMMRWITLVVCGALVPLGMAPAGEALAAGTKLCIPLKENKPVKTPKAGACATGFTLTELGAEGKEGTRRRKRRKRPAGRKRVAG